MRKHRFWIRCLVVPLLLGWYAAHVSEYNAASCAAVANTLNFHWEKVTGAGAPCTGIEYTNGSFAQAASGMLTMAGLSVSNPSCIGTATYTLTLSADKTTLSGLDTKDSVPMTLVRGPGEDCFVGHWTLGPHDFVGHIAAAPFLQGTNAVPALGGSALFALAALVAFAGGLAFLKQRR
jgi:hypothetical protein